MILEAFLIAIGAAAGQTPPRADLTLKVPATANPYLAGMPAGTRAQVGDQAPQQSPVEVPVSMDRVAWVSFKASGGVDHTPNCTPGCSSPGGAELVDHQGGAEHGIAGIRAPMNALVGVFLGDDRPDRTKAPRSLDFRKIGLDFESLSPQLKQVFMIGTGATRKGSPRRFLVPKGATRLFLGVMDGYEWNNNTGAFSVALTIERMDVESNLFSVDSSVAFAKWPCLAGRKQCTPERELVEPKGPGQYHIVLPAHLEWGASLQTPNGAAVQISGAKGTVCLIPSSRSSCHGPEGSGKRSDGSFLAPGAGVGALVTRSAGGRTYFSVNDRAGAAFQRHEGYFEFDVTVR